MDSTLTCEPRRIQALEAQVQDLLRTQQPGSITQQPLPEDPPYPPVPSERPTTGDVIDEELLSSEKGETLFDLYKSELMPHFPFVIIPAQASGRNWRYQKTFMFLAIVTVASYHDLGLQEKLGELFKQQVVDKVLFGGDDCLSLEYLQGLLIVLSWYSSLTRPVLLSQLTPQEPISWQVRILHAVPPACHLDRSRHAT